MGILDDEAKEHIKNLLADLKENVTIKVFTQETECQFCKETRQLVEEIADGYDKIKVEVYDFVKDKETAAWHGIDKIPAIVVEGDKSNGVRFFGVPAGYELSSLLEVIKWVSTGETGLKTDTVETLEQLTNPVHIKVFVTLTCPKCPKAVHTAHQMALVSDKVRADMIESAEFPRLANKYGVYEVPKVVINDTVEFIGAIPEKAFLNYVRKAAQSPPKEESGQA